MLNWFSFLLAAAWALAPTFAYATVAVGLDPEGLANRSQMVIEGRVESLESHVSPDGRQIVTTVRIQVEETWKGAPARTVEIVVPGGAAGELAQVVHGAPRFTEGEEVVVFLDRPRPDVAYAVVGLAQGKFSVREGPDGRQVAVQDLRELELVDPHTKRPTAAPIPGPIPLETLRREVVRAERGE